MRQARVYPPHVISASQAASEGLKLFFTGVPCSSGHHDYRFVSDRSCVLCRYLSCAARQARNPEAKRAADKRWNAKHPAKVRSKNAAYHANNQAVVLARHTAARIAHPEKWRIAATNRRARKKGAEGSYTWEETKNLFKLQRGRCAYSGKAMRPAWCLGKITLETCNKDHIAPLASHGTNWIGNIQLTCRPCNMHKHASDPVAFARELGCLL